MSHDVLFGANETVPKAIYAGGYPQVFDFSPMGTWRHMSQITIFVCFILLIMSICSIVIVVDRYMTFRAARTQSREFAQKVASSLRSRKVDEAISLSGKYKKSHLAVVVNAGLQEFCAHQSSGDISGAVLDAPERALRRAAAIKTAEFRRRLSGLATIGSTAPLVGLFGTTFGLIDAFMGMGEEASAGISAVAAGIAESLVTTAVGLAVGVLTVWLFNYFSNKVDNFIVEMDNSSAELIDFFLKQRGEKDDD
jgi:biopolymer transport protein ExbB/biopolymer transport protein TolQ